jgi:hypothetical protein
MSTREELTAKRLRLAMKPLHLRGHVFIRTTFDWRTGAILGAGVWKAPHYVRGYRWYIGVEPDIDDFLMMGEWY